MKRNPTLIPAFALMLIVLAAGCHGAHEDPILRLSAAESLEQGKALIEQEKYFKAQRYLTHAFEVEPNSRGGREALLLAADALYLNGGYDNFIKCEAKYRDFLNRFPTSDRADYAQFQVANCLARRVEKPDRDQKVTRQALEAYQELLRLYPTSSYAEDARQEIENVTDRLAMHELIVAKFYLRFGLCQATISRLEGVVEEYPRFTSLDESLLYLGLGYHRCARPDDAETTFAKLRQDFPQSSLLSEIEGLQKKFAPRKPRTRPKTKG